MYTGMGMSMLNLQLMKAPNYDYDLSLTLNVTFASDYGLDNRVWIGPGESISYNLEGSIQRVQWRTWDMRDNWMDLSEFNSWGQ